MQLYQASHRRVVIEAGFVVKGGVVTDCAPILRKRILGMELDKALATLASVGYKVNEVDTNYQITASPRIPKKQGLLGWMKRR